jgi:ADP-heptose:LPS heptosyltransferase
MSFETILVYSQGEVVGDGILKLPFLAALRSAWPQAHLTWATAGPSVYTSLLKPIAEQLANEVRPGLAEELGWRAFLSPPLAGRHFDLVIDTQTQVARAMAVRLIRHDMFVTKALGYRLSARRPECVPPESILGQLLLLASLAAGRDLVPVTPPAARGRWAEAAAALLPPGPRYVGLAPGAGHGWRERCWPRARYIALAQRLTAKGLVPVLMLGPEEADWVEEFRAALPQAVLPEWGRSDAFQDLQGPCLAIALSGRLAGGVANNAGPAQIIAAGGVPVVALHQRHRSAHKFRPVGERVQTLCAEDFGSDPDDMSLIPVEAVEAALDKVLS